ncbi:MAG: glycosyltransferase family 4 protein [Bacteroidota bacterium]|nr:glycosyltransferase family 4 protein [Bacteroidota bacterium]
MKESLMQNKKIFFLADSNSIHTAKWVDYFIDQGFDVYLATFSRVNITKCNNLYILGNKNPKVKGGNYYYLLYVNELSKILNQIKPDVINAHFSYSIGLVALLAKTISRTKSIFSVVCHGNDILSPPMPYLFDKINKYILSKCNKIFAVSDQIKDKIFNMGISSKKVFVGQYGINQNVYNNQIKKDIDILSNRSYVPNSRIEFLLDSLEAFRYDGLKIVFILPHADDDKVKELEAKYSFVKFYKFLPYEQIINMISRTKIYISATKSDGTSLSLMEAMSCGAIPVVSNIVSNRSWVLDGVNGYLFDTDKQLIKSIKVALSQDNENKINVNKKLIFDKCNYLNQMKKIENFLFLQEECH